MREETTSIPLAHRLEMLLNHLGVHAAHFGARTPQDIQGLLHTAPQRVASLTLVGANARPDALNELGSRMLWITGDGGSIGAMMRPRLSALPPDRVHVLEGYDEFQWSDTVADRTSEIADRMERLLREASLSGAVKGVELADEGEVAEISYVAAGSGPPVVLLPLGLAARQWDALLPILQRRYATIVLGGPHLAPVKMLESRGASHYGPVALGVLALAKPGPADSLIEVGCGSGALLRRIVQTYGMGRVTGLDVNRFLLNQAAALAQKEGLTDRISLREGSAEDIPFPSSTFDVVFSSTVMEEVDADRMMAELARIAKPGGRVAVMVRAVDQGSLTNAPVPETLRRHIEAPGAGGMNERGCADASLATRMHKAGLTSIQGGPAWAWTRPGDGWWENVDSQIRAHLSPEEADIWSQTLADSHAHGVPLWVARPFHAAVGTKR